MARWRHHNEVAHVDAQESKQLLLRDGRCAVRRLPSRTAQDFFVGDVSHLGVGLILLQVEGVLADGNIELPKA